MTVAIWVALCIAGIIDGHWLTGTAGLLLLAGSAPGGRRLRARRRCRAAVRIAASAPSHAGEPRLPAAPRQT